MNPWKEIDLGDYEKHMCLSSVFQLQALNQIMERQFRTYAARSAMILGIAGGNGLEHINPQNFHTVYGVDINKSYLHACTSRYPALSGILKTICADLTQTAAALPHADLLVADLFIEYIGYTCFQEVVRQVNPKYLSCVIQLNLSSSFVSDSPYLHAFDHLTEVHHVMKKEALIYSMEEMDYMSSLQEETELPNEKKLVRLDFTR